MNKDRFYKELYNLYGPVTRARNCFLYTKKGIRITDCYQENGRAILGWEGGNAFTHFKNVLSRGQTGSFICEEKSRVTKAVSELLASDRKVFFFSSKQDALAAAVRLCPESTSVYKPWSEVEIKWADIQAVLIEPPLPWTETLYILAVKPQFTAEETHLPGSIFVPFALQTGVTRAIYNLIAAIQERQEKDWFIYDPVLTKYFERKGPYLYPKVPEEKYEDFVLHCLTLGILINPDWNGKSIVPFGADRGVFTKLKNSPFNY